MRAVASEYIFHEVDAVAALEYWPKLISLRASGTTMVKWCGARVGGRSVQGTERRGRTNHDSAP